MLTLILTFALPYITHVINSCIEYNTFPTQWNSAVVLPLSLKPTYRLTISIYVPLVINKVLTVGFHVWSQLLLRVTDDIIGVRVRGELSLLVLLDFNRAFDTIRYDQFSPHDIWVLGPWLYSMGPLPGGAFV